MAGSTFGKQFKITTWGESHGAGVGVVIDGCPAGLSLSSEDIQLYLNRRKPGQSRFTTPRKEDDAVEILSGVFEGKTTGTPISLVVYNCNQKSKDYSEIAACYRPGHADYTYDQKYGFRDYRGGGRSSARETIARVAAGSTAYSFQRFMLRRRQTAAVGLWRGVYVFIGRVHPVLRSELYLIIHAEMPLRLFMDFSAGSLCIFNRNITASQEKLYLILRAALSPT